MATIIDSLLVSLGLDTSAYKKGQAEASAAHKKTREAVEKDNKGIEESSRKAADSLHKIKQEVLALTAVLLGGYGIKAFAENITRTDAALGRMSKNVHMSTQDISAWEGVVKRTGGSAESMDGTLKGLVSQFQQFALTGQSAVIPYFRAVGVAISDAQGNMRSMNDILLDLADKFQSMDPAKAQALGAGMGLDEGTINLLTRGRGEVEKLLAAQRALNVVSEEDAKRAQARANAWQNLIDKGERLGRIMMNDVQPAIEIALKALTRFLDFAEQHMLATEIIASALAVAFGAMAAVSFVGVLSGLAGMVPAIGAVSTSMGGLLLLLGKAGLLGAAGAVGYGLGTLLNKGYEALRGNSSAGSDFYSLTHPGEGAGLDPSRQSRGRIGGGRGATGSSGARGIRNNNPGNLNFAGQRGAHREGGPGRFAAFDSMEEGVAAMARQLQSYAAHGVDTVSAIINKWAPSKENGLNKTNSYIESVTRALGVNANQRLNLNDPAVLQNLIQAMSRVEVGGISRTQIDSGLSYGLNHRMVSIGGGTNTNSSDVRIGQININTPATDAAGIARDIAPAVKDNFSFASQANYGLQ